MRIALVQHGPDKPAAVGLADQRKDRIVGQQALGAAESDVNQLLERWPVAECGGIGVEKEKQDIARGRAASKGVEMISVDLDAGQFLRLEPCFGGRRNKIPERHPDDVFAALID